MSPQKDVATTVPRALSSAPSARMIQPGVAERRLSLGRRAAIEGLGTGLLGAAGVG